MDKRNIIKLFIVIVLLFLTCHFILHRLQRDKGQIVKKNNTASNKVVVPISDSTKRVKNSQEISTKFILAGYQEYTQLDIGNAIFDTRKAPKQKLIHAKVFLRGKVSKSSILGKNEIIVYRIVVSCCAADGTPLGILVKLPERVSFQNDEWVGVEGTIQLLTFDEKYKSVEPVAAIVPPEKIFPYFTATKAYKIQPPRDEYLFP